MTKTAKHVNLGDKLFFTKDGMVNQTISDRKWYEVKDMTVRSLELSDDGREIIVNKSKPDATTFGFNEAIFTERAQVVTIANTLNATEKKKELERRDILYQQAEESEEIITFYDKLSEMQK